MNLKEIQFETDIEKYLLSKGGYIKGDMTTYDKKNAIDMPKLIEFIKKTQPKEWAKYERNYGVNAERNLYKRFQECVEKDGLIYVIKHGFEDRGAKIRVAAFKQNSALNQTVIDEYNSNILTCTRQFKYSTENENAIDMVLSLNGIPIVALELKNQLTGQSVDNAKKQYMLDRNPKEFCFHFNNRFLVYFAVDLYEVAMTTKLDGKKTMFLPFNQGSNGAGKVGGAGNPTNNNGYTTEYLWKTVLEKDCLMNILEKFIQKIREEKVVYKNGVEQVKKVTKLIFPRYHQLDVVNKLIDDVKVNGSGKNYLIQHSAGSGKSNSIAWLAYQLAEMHDNNDNPLFKSVIVVNDRTVLDRQTQDTIFGFDHVGGIVEKIDEDKNSSDLRDAINNGKKIIITTLQKFPYIYEEINASTNKNFAIIVDEAHSSQTGKSSQKLKFALADTTESLKEFAELEGKEEDEIKDTEDKIVDEIISQGQFKNLSFFAFTATPKQRTLEMFGTPRATKGFEPFHIYSMRQAIEEGFILDVLQNFMHYKTCYKIAKQTSENPELNKNQALKTILRYQDLHPHNISQKTAIIVEYYRTVTKSKIGGNAKAMVVTASRLHALRYYHEMKRYLERKGYDDIEILIAFSGVLKDEDGTEYSEESINKRKDGSVIKEEQLPAEFNKEEYGMLIVAEKYQTGYDEPLLHTMFVDKKLKGVKAVQTLSRLNRVCEGKNDTFILDFVNKPEEIKEAFLPYYEATYLEEEINVNMIYDTKTNLRRFDIYNDKDVEEFLKIYLKKGKQTDSDLGKIASLLKPVVDKYKKLDDKKQFEFKKTLRNYNKWYEYITQITRLFDQNLQKEYHYTVSLEKLLPKKKEETVDLEDKLKLEYYKLSEDFHNSISLTSGQGEGVLSNPKSLKPIGKTEQKDELLDSIITSVNEKFKGIFTDNDKVIVDTLYQKVKSNEKLKKQAEKNDEEVFIQSIFPDAFKKDAQDCYAEQMKAFAKLFEDKNLYKAIMETIAKQYFQSVNKDKKG